MGNHSGAMTSFAPNSVLGGFNLGFQNAQGMQQQRQQQQLAMLQMVEQMRIRRAQEARQQQQDAAGQQADEDLHQNRLQQNLLLERKVANRRMLDQTVRQLLMARDAKIINPDMAEQGIKKAAIQFADDPSDILLQYHREEAEKRAADREQRMGEQFQQQQERMQQFHEDSMQSAQAQMDFKTQQEAQKVEMAQQKAAADAQQNAVKQKMEIGKAKIAAAKDTLSHVTKLHSDRRSMELKNLNAQLAAASKMFDEEKMAELKAKIDSIIDDAETPPDVVAAQQNYDSALGEFSTIGQEQQPQTPAAPTPQPSGPALAPEVTGQMGPPGPAQASQPAQPSPHVAAMKQVVQMLQNSGGQMILDLARQGDPGARAQMKKMAEQIMQGAQQ